ncbi:MAG TPA: hypothetical protein DDW73_14790 [Rhizobium sp.]|nr:hypothetical protein [Rhizobium sp.]
MSFVKGQILTLPMGERFFKKGEWVNGRGSWKPAPPATQKAKCSKENMLKWVLASLILAF